MLKQSIVYIIWLLTRPLFSCLAACFIVICRQPSPYHYHHHQHHQYHQQQQQILQSCTALVNNCFSLVTLIELGFRLSPWECILYINFGLCVSFMLKNVVFFCKFTTQ